MINFYSTLGVKQDASQQAILAAYHRLSKRRRPAASDEEAVKLFEAFQAEIENAFIWLGDPEGRKQFDQILDNYNLATSLKEDFKVENKVDEVDLAEGLRDAVKNLRRERLSAQRKPFKYLLRARAAFFKRTSICSLRRLRDVSRRRRSDGLPSCRAHRMRQAGRGSMRCGPRACTPCEFAAGRAMRPLTSPVNATRSLKP